VGSEFKEFEAKTPTEHDSSIDYWIYDAKTAVWNQSLPLDDYEFKIEDKN
jgi:hypothetical protein